jgi:hypothetical protein
MKIKDIIIAMAKVHIKFFFVSKGCFDRNGDSEMSGVASSQSVRGKMRLRGTAGSLVAKERDNGD